MLKTRHLLLALGIFAFILVGCKDTSKTENGTNNTSSPKTEKKTNANATIQLDDGRTIEMKDKRPRGNSNAPSRFTVNISDDLILMVQLDAYDTNLETKAYDEPTVATLVLTSISHDGPIGKEAYRSYNDNADGKEGEAKITLTSFKNSHAEGTFKGTLYSQNHKKAVVEGAFNTSWKKKW